MRGSVSFTLVTGTFQIVCSVVAAQALTRSSSVASNQMPPQPP